MDRVKKGWHKTPRALRKILIFSIGWVVVITGVILLPLPGPGWAIIFLGFAILATEFTTAEKVRDWLVAILKKLIAWGLAMWRKTRPKH